MKAVVVDHSAPAHLSIQEVGEPSPLSGEAVVRVAAISLNRGEVRRAEGAEQGFRIGWDFAGIVENPAEDGSGPKAGARVVGFLPNGAWAERVAAPSRNIAELPDAVSFEDALTLPVAGLTAYHALAYGGLLLGKRVLVTGATGGVGHFAVQLARASGAHVVAAVRRPEQEKLVREAGAQDVAVGEDLAGAKQFGPYDLIPDGVGGATLGAALGLLSAEGMAVSFGVSGGSEASFRVDNFFRIGGTSYRGFYLFHELQKEAAGIGLARLAALIGDGRLKPLIDSVQPWSAVANLAQGLLDRKYPGKAVLTIG